MALRDRLRTATTFSHGTTGMAGWQRMARSQCHPNDRFAKVHCSCRSGKNLSD